MYKVSKDKRGFTFVELSAVIGIIAIIVSIALPLTIKAVGNARVKMMKNQEELLSLVGKDYFLDNREMLPEQTGKISTITLATLVKEGYTQEVKDYKKEICDHNKSYIEVYKVKKGQYQYYTYLECNNYVTGNVKIGQEYLFDYSQAEQTFTAPANGMYQIEAWGAQGEGPGGEGGYVSGDIYLRAGDTLYIQTGGIDGTNGGGSGVYSGGGATTIKYTNKIIIAAAGGGGGIGGTNGGTGNASGGIYKAGAGVTTPAAGSAGRAGTNGGGGGSGNIYRDCTGYEQVYNACLTGENTCQAGYVNGTCNTYYNCQNSACGYASCRTAACGCQTYINCQNSACGTSCNCPGGWNYDGGSSCYQGMSTRTLWRWYYKKCNCTCTYRYAPGPTTCSTTTNSISNGTYYNTSTCSSACSQKNSGTVGTGCNGLNKHVSGSGSCNNQYTDWSVSSAKPSSSYNDSWYETTTENYCPTGNPSGGNCWIGANCWYNTCRTAACGCETYNQCVNSACGYATCRTAACGCEVYNQVYSPCATGANTCQGGYENGACNSFTSEKHEPGQGGSNIVDTSIITYQILKSGVNTGNGHAKIVFRGR